MVDEDEDVPRVSAQEAAERVRSGDVIILDVREPFERELARVDGTWDVPMGDVPGHLDDFPRDKPVVVMCHSGIRSHQVAKFLRSHAIDAANLVGGIDAWARDVDPDVGTY